jgi:hypothetical protein
MTQQSSSPHFPEQKQRVGLALDRTRPLSIRTAAGSKETHGAGTSTPRRAPSIHPSIHSIRSRTDIQTNPVSSGVNMYMGMDIPGRIPLTMLVLAATISRENVAGAR